MKILVTHPGKYGDLIWALPTCRALAEVAGEPVDLQIPNAYEPLLCLLRLQPYLGEIHIDPDWVTQDTAPRTPVQPSALCYPADTVLHLGYRAWPRTSLPYEVERNLIDDFYGTPLGKARIDLSRPWITPPPWTGQLPARPIAYGWTDEHFELKVGLTRLIFCNNRAVVEPHPRAVNLSNSPRWNAEYYEREGWTRWDEAAAWISQAAVFLGDCSALHVLACGLGVPCVIMEPAEARHHSIFWPFGTKGPQVTQVIGTDGKWTWDARHVAETLEAVGRRRVEEGAPQ